MVTSGLMIELVKQNNQIESVRTIVNLIKCTHYARTKEKKKISKNYCLLNNTKRHCEIANDFIKLPPHRCEISDSRVCENEKKKKKRNNKGTKERITLSQIETNM